MMIYYPSHEEKLELLENIICITPVYIEEFICGNKMVICHNEKYKFCFYRNDELLIGYTPSDNEFDKIIKMMQ